MSDWLASTVRTLRVTTDRLIGNRRDADGVATTDAMLAGRPVRRFVPAGASDTRMLYFHGGGFISGSIDSHHGLCSRLAAQGRFQLVSASYRLAPEHPAPAQYEDALAVASAMAATPGRLLIGGDSAGAWLALRCALALHDQQPGRIDGALLLYPFVDLEAQADTLIFYARPAVAVMRAALQQAYPSLLDLDLARAPPCALLWGAGLDPVAPGAAALAEGLAAAGVATRVQRHPLLVHGGLNLASRVTLIDRLLAAAVADLDQIAEAG